MLPFADSIITWHGCKAARFPARPGFVYMVHFNSKIGNPEKAKGQAQHYLGSTGSLDARLTLHRNGNGAAIMAAVGKAGVGWQLCRLWRCDTLDEARALERRLKARHEGPRFCPLCNPRVKTDVLVSLRAGHWPLSLHGVPGRRAPLAEACPRFVRRASDD